MDPNVESWLSSLFHGHHFNVYVFSLAGFDEVGFYVDKMEVDMSNAPSGEHPESLIEKIILGKWHHVNGNNSLWGVVNLYPKASDAGTLPQTSLPLPFSLQVWSSTFQRSYRQPHRAAATACLVGGTAQFLPHVLTT